MGFISYLTRLSPILTILITHQVSRSCHGFSTRRILSQDDSQNMALPHNIKCTSHNWEGMVCTWNPGLETNQLVNTTQTLVWTIIPPSGAYLCPHQNGTVCEWLWMDGADSFRPAVIYFMMVVVQDEDMNTVAQSGVTRVNTRHIVKPSKVENVTALVRGPHSALLSWRPPKGLFSHVVALKYQVSYHIMDDVHSEQMVLETHKPHIPLQDLAAKTRYVLSIRVRSAYRGYWSEPVTRTLETMSSLSISTLEMEATSS